MKEHTVFSAGPDGRYTRHSEGAFLRLKDGRLLFVYSRFTGSQDDGAPSDLVAMTSGDEGETWSQPEVTLPASSHGIDNIMSVSLMRMNSGDVGMFYLAKRRPDDTACFLELSRDEGRTWYRRIECIDQDRRGYYVVNNDRVIRLSSGRLLIPANLHRGGSDPTGATKIHWDGRGVAFFFWSDDDGETWHESPDAVFPPFTRTDAGLQETGVIELKNGAVWGYARTDQHVQYEFFSHDGGLHWTAAQPSRFTAPPSPLKIARRPQDGLLYAVWNPVPNYNGRELSRAGWGRTPLVWASSADEGVTWSEPRVIEGQEDHGYCYPAIFFTDDGAMLTAYCAGGPDDGICLARLTIRKIPLEG